LIKYFLFLFSEKKGRLALNANSLNIRHCSNSCPLFRMW
jgi:hypothetical protein